MLKDRVHNRNVADEHVLITPEALDQAIPMTDRGNQSVASSRRIIKDIVEGKDSRLLVVTGPCSIHDVDAAKEYALKLKELAKELDDTLYIVMRIYFEKPRTTVGWKGLINDPDMNDSFDIEKGLKTARELLVWLADQEIPAGTEALDPVSPQYLSELFSWSAIGARTTESQTHREMASGLSMPVGFKNGTDGSLSVALNALHSVSAPHSFLGINQAGQVAIINTLGNPHGHIILRGGKQPNYDSVSVALCEEQLEKSGLEKNIVVDCSHGNSNKQFALQGLVAENVGNQIKEGNESIIGIMLESHLNEGNQKITEDHSEMQYGVSVTDACISWETTETVLRNLRDQIKDSLPQRKRLQS